MGTMMENTENTQAVRVKKVPQWVVDTHKYLASQQGKSFEGYLRELLTEMALKPKQEAAQRLEIKRQELREKYGNRFPDTTALIRQERDDLSC